MKMRYLILCFAVIILTITPKSPLANESLRVDMLLVLAADVSSSIDEEEHKIVRHGHALAITDDVVINAVLNGLRGKIAVTYIEWSGVGGHQRVVIPWSVIDSHSSAQSFAERLQTEPRSFSNGKVSRNTTCIMEALEFSKRQLLNSPYKGSRWVIDLVGDGQENDLNPTNLNHELAAEYGIQINALAIDDSLPPDPMVKMEIGTLKDHYVRYVAAGPGSFVFVARGFSDVPKQMRNKFQFEIALVTPNH